MNAVERVVHSRITALATLCAALCVSACASLPAPRERVPTADNAPKDPMGAWANVRYRGFAGDRYMVSGELLAANQDSLYLSANAKFLSMSMREIDQVQVVMYNPQESGAYGVGWLLALSTLSHGWYVVFSFPVWLGITAGVGGGRVDDAVLAYPRETEEIARLQMFARFPQGLPDAFNRAQTRAVSPHRPIPKEQPPPAPIGFPTYQKPERLGNGIVASGGLWESGKGAWSAGYHHRVTKELFAMGGYTNFDRDAIDMDQWWAGLRLGDPAFFGAKYIYTSQLDESKSGISAFIGVLTPTSQHIAIGLMAGWDFTNLERYAPSADYFWTQAMLQLTLKPQK